MEWIYWPLRMFLYYLPPIEIALTLGCIFFALSWVRPRRIVSLPASGRRARTLVWLGIAGSSFVVGVATVTSWLPTLDPTIQADGWWQRPAPLAATALVLALAAIALRREPLPNPGERQIAPRRRWWHFTPRAALWTTIATATLLLFTVTWQILIGVSAPRDADRYGIGPEWTELPGFASFATGYYWGAGWPNHLATFAALLLAAGLFALVLGGDANRPVFSRRTAAQVKTEREATARMLTLIGLGGVLLALGAVWAFVGFIGQTGMSVDEPDADGRVSLFINTGYAAFAPLMHLGGYIIQGIGAALLLRLAVDTARARRAHARMHRADGPDPAAVLADAEGPR